MLLAKALAVDVLDMTPYRDPVTFHRVQVDWLRNKVHSLREIHAAMLAAFRRAGCSVDRLEEVLVPIHRWYAANKERLCWDEEAKQIGLRC